MHAMLCHLVCSHQDKVIFPLDFSSILEIYEKVQIHGSQSEMLSLVLKKKKKKKNFVIFQKVLTSRTCFHLPGRHRR